MNTVLTEMWLEYNLDESRIIINSFKQNHIVSLKPPKLLKSDEDYFRSTMQSGSIKTSEYIDIIYNKT